jgi:hypothetical protein
MFKVLSLVCNNHAPFFPLRGPNNVYANLYYTLLYPQSGNFVKDDVWHALIVLISNASELQGYSVRSLYMALQACGAQVWRHIVFFVNCVIDFHAI